MALKGSFQRDLDIDTERIWGVKRRDIYIYIDYCSFKDHILSTPGLLFVKQSHKGFVRGLSWVCGSFMQDYARLHTACARLV